MNKKTLCIDFDGVIHSYTSGWKGAGVVTDPPVEGAIEWLVHASKIFDICIYSSRSKSISGQVAMRRWLKHYVYEYMARSEIAKQLAECMTASDYMDFEKDPVLCLTNEVLERLRFPLFKPAAWLTIDDRAICFSGSFPSIAQIETFMPWYKRDDH